MFESLLPNLGTELEQLFLVVRRANVTRDDFVYGGSSLCAPTRSGSSMNVLPKRFAVSIMGIVGKQH
jgi:hypothetical protein